MPIVVQQDATIYSLFISVNRSTCFGWYLLPSSGAPVIVSTASGISKTVNVSGGISSLHQELLSFYPQHLALVKP